MPTLIEICDTGAIKPHNAACFLLPNGTEILVAHTEHGFFATDSICTHEDSPLCNGAVKNGTISCPLHGSRFDLKTGQALEEPAQHALKVYPLEIRDGKVHVAIG